MGEDVTDMATTTSQLQAKLLALTGGKVDIMLDENTFKNSTQILREMAEAWEDMTDVQRASALELMGGKRQANVLSALIQNFDTVESVIETSANSAGSALKENERYLDSIQGKIDQFNNAVQALWSDTLNSDVVKFFVDLATKLVKVVDAVGPLNIALVGLVAFLEKNYGVFSNFFAPAENNAEELKQQLKKAEQDLAKATQADMQHGDKKTAQNRRDAEERVAILKSKIQESSSEAILDGIDESFDPDKVKKQISGKKGAITKRAKKLESEGKTFNEIQNDPKIQQYTKDIQESEQALNAYTAAEQANKVAIEETGDAREEKTASTWGAVAAEITNKDATGASVLATFKQVAANKLAGNSFVQMGLEAMVASGAITAEAAASAANLPITTLLTAGFTGLAASIKTAALAMWELMTTTPLGPILLLIAGVAAAIAAFSYFHKTTEELQEELSGLKSELSDIRSELESVNSELETANERMAELLAKDSLTFVEQEELDRLKEITAQLERQKGLLESKEKYQAGRVGRMAARTVNSAKSEKDWYENVPVLRLFTGSTTAEEDVKRRIKNYAGWKEQSDNAAPFLQDIAQQQLDDTSAHIDEYIQTLSEALEGIEYGDSAESDAALDYLAELEDSYAIARGAAGAKTNAIKGLINKDEFASELIAINKYVEALKNGDSNAEESIANIIKNNKDLVEDLEARGLEAQDAVDYFTKLGDNLRFDTPEGKEQEIARAKNSMHSLMDGLRSGSIDVNTLFDEEGKIIQTELSEMFKGTSEKTRAELTKLLEGAYNQIADGLNEGEMESLIQRFGIKMELALLDVKNAALAEQNIELFPGLKEEIEGIIDSFSEMSSALNSVVDAMDLLEQARAEEAYSGSISLETMAKLMEQTDDYSKILSIDEYGAIKLVSNAEDILIDQRIDKIKTDTQAALAVAQKTNEEAKAAEQDALNAKQTLELSGPSQQWYIKVLNVLAGAIAYVGSLWESITTGNFGGMFDRASEAYTKASTIFHDDAAEAEHAKQLAEANSAYEAAVANRENSEKELKKAEDNANIANKITRDNIKASVDSETASGGNKTKDEVEDDLFQKEMDYWENRIAANRAKRDQIQNEIDLLESQGIRAGEEYYKELIALEEERKALLIAQRDEALAYLSTQEEGSEEWWNAAKIVNDLEGEIDDATASIQDFRDAQAQIKWDNLEEITSRFSDLHDEVSDLRDILQREDMFDSDGNWTESGAAVLGTYVYDLEAYKNELATLQAEIADLQAHPYNEANAAYLKETYSIDSEQEYNDLMTQWNKEQRNLVKGAYDTADAIKDAYSQQVDAIEDAINEQIDAYNDYIDVVKEAYDAERELHEFKKDIQKQSRSIAETERRIASLSGSTNAADIAERRKLEAQLAEQRESINDSYYNHANDQRSNALDNEAQAYEESMNRYVEGLRETLEEQAQGLITFTETGAMVTNEFLNGVTATVMQNAGLILEKYEEVSPYMSDELKQPFIDASNQLGVYGNDLSILNAWTSDSGYFGQFKTTASGQMTTPFINGSAAASAFKTSATSAMNDIASNVRSNVSNITSNLGSVQSAYSGIITTANQAKAAIDQANAAAAAGASYTGTAGSNYGATVAPATVDSRILSKYKLSSDQVLALGYGPISLEKFEDLLRNYLIKYSNKFSKAQIWNTTSFERSIGDFGANYVSGPWAIRQYAKGTTGTTRDEWAITDEFGPELKMYATPEGNLSFMAIGSTVVPHDLTMDLIELPSVVDGLINRPNFDSGINMISSAVNKPELNITFDSLVKAENITEETLPAVRKLVTQELNRFTKELNYALKGKGAR